MNLKAKGLVVKDYLDKKQGIRKIFMVYMGFFKNSSVILFVDLEGCLGYEKTRIDLTVHFSEELWFGV